MNARAPVRLAEPTSILIAALGGQGGGVVKGDDGNDKLFGGAGKDQVFGGEGADAIEGGGERDYIFGDTGTLNFDGAVPVRIRSLVGEKDGADTIKGDGGDDIIFGGGNIDTINGNDGNDLILGDGGNFDFVSGAIPTKDGKVDVFFWIGGVPTAAVKDLVSTNASDVVFLNTGELAAKLAEKYPGVYLPATLKAGAYDGLTADLPVLGVDNVLLVPAALEEGVVGEVLAAIFDNLEEVHAIHPVAKTLSLETASRQTAVPYHPGAIAFYKSRGIAMK